MQGTGRDAAGVTRTVSHAVLAEYQSDGTVQYEQAGVEPMSVRLAMLVGLDLAFADFIAFSGYIGLEFGSESISPSPIIQLYAGAQSLVKRDWRRSLQQIELLIALSKGNWIGRVARRDQRIVREFDPVGHQAGQKQQLFLRRITV
jgi:hypothetical protein